MTRCQAHADPPRERRAGGAKRRRCSTASPRPERCSSRTRAGASSVADEELQEQPDDERVRRDPGERCRASPVDRTSAAASRRTSRAGPTSRKSRIEPPRTSDARDGAGPPDLRPDRAPAGSTLETVKPPRCSRRSPKSPCSARHSILDVLHEDRPVGAEQVLRVRDLRRRRVLDVDEEPGRVRGHLRKTANVISDSSRSSTIDDSRRRTKRSTKAEHQRTSAGRSPRAGPRRTGSARAPSGGSRRTGRCVGHGWKSPASYASGSGSSPTVCRAACPSSRSAA